MNAHHQHHYLRSAKGFTLLEVIISGVILAIVSMSAYSVFENFSSLEVRSTDRVVAGDVISSTLETTKRQIESGNIVFANLPNLSDTTWVPMNVANYPNGFFQRMTTYTSAPNGVVNAIVQIRWQDEQGIWQQAQNTFSLSAPPSLIFGNIAGTITNCVTKAPLPSVSVSVLSGPPNQSWILGTSRQTNANGNYDFRDGQGSNVLPVGNGYRLQAVLAGFNTATSPGITQPAINLPQFPTHTENFCMTPSNATIAGRLVSTNPAVPIGWKRLTLAQNGAQAQGIGVASYNSPAASFSFSIPFPPNSPTTQCFTLATGMPNQPSLAPYRMGFWGDFCGQNFLDGWSSAIMGNIGQAPICPIGSTTPWFGNSTLDQDPQRGICLQAGQLVTVGDIPLTPLPDNVPLTVNIHVPTVAIAGSVTYSVSWSDGNSFRSARTTPPPDPNVVCSSPTSCTSTLNVPPLFLMGVSPNYMRVQAFAKREVSGCCGESVQQKALQSDVVFAYITGTTNQVDVTIPEGNDALCGNARGTMKNLETEALLAGACEIKLTGNGISYVTEGCNWQFICCACNNPPNPERGVLKAGSYTTSFDALGYYCRSSCSSCCWPMKTVSSLSVQPNTITQPSPNPIFQEHFSPDPFDVFLYRKGIGTIMGRVVDRTGNGVANAAITFYAYSEGTGQAFTADANGYFGFAAIESWPPNNDFNSLPAGAKRNHFWTREQDRKRHSIAVVGTRGNRTGTGSAANILVNMNAITNLGDVVVEFPADL